MKALIVERRMRFMRIVNCFFLLVLMSAAAMALEEPRYRVVERHPDFELREYAPYVVAEVDVSGDLDNADGKAFRILAGYIFGDNEAAEKMEMTAPVESRSAKRSEKMAMTAPVTASVADTQGMMTYPFVMESKYTLETLPRPIDQRIRIREVPARTVAVRGYSGRWTEKNYLQHQESLQSALRAQGIQAVGAPTLARYNSPFSLPFMRRNEVMIQVRPE